MQWLQIISAFGIGALCIKILDILWLQRVIQRHELRTWLKNKRLESYTNLSKIMITLGLYGSSADTFAQFAVASEAMLLTEDDALVDCIDQFIVKLNRFYRLSDNKDNAENDKEADKLYMELSKEARVLLKELRDNLIIEQNNRPITLFRKIYSQFRRNSYRDRDAHR